MTKELEAQVSIQPGDAVIILSRCSRTNQIGLAHSWKNGRWRIQFGASGSFSYFNPESIRHATSAEIKARGLYGTGFRRIIDMIILS